MDTATMITNMFIDEWNRLEEMGKDEEACFQGAKLKVFRAGWYLDKGVWKNVKDRKKDKKTTSMYKNRKDENKALAKIKVNTDGRFA